MGGVEFLFEASRFLNDQALHNEARVELEKMILNSRHDVKNPPTLVDGVLDLSLFRGLAGLGYTALRQLEPSLPNILIWE